MSVKEIVLESIEITGKTVLSCIPVGGTLATCIFDSVKAHAAQKRLDEWKTVIEGRLSNIEMSIEDIGNNGMFASAVMRATDIALKTAEGEKRIYLGNAVFNSISSPLDECIMMMYLNMLDEYTVWHIKILDYFSNPQAYNINVSNCSMGSAVDPLLQAFPELKSRTGIVDKIVSDFQQSGLMQQGSYLHGGMTGSGMIAARTTELGNDFLKFIKNM